MSLRDQYFAGVTGLTQKLKDAHDAGVVLVGTGTGVGQWDAITTGLQANASSGLKKFTVTIATTYLPAALRGNKGDNLILKAYLSGITEQLSNQLIYDFECTPTLNTTDSVNTSIDLNFTFA
jgi:hypothetical protein